MELQQISQVTKKYGISVSALRYYEKAGLIQSIRNDDNAYRFYDEVALKRLHFITLLRKLRVSVKQIKEILNNQNALTTVEIFERNINELDEEITSLSTIKSILIRFAEELRTKADMVLEVDLLKDTDTVSIIDSISFSKNYINSTKENLSMEDLNKANETLEKLEEEKVRKTAEDSQLKTEPNEEIAKNNQSTVEKFEIIEQFGPYRFIGKAAYARAWQASSEQIWWEVWKNSSWIFDTLDNLKEYASDDIYNHAFESWDKFDENNNLMGYIVGRFMKPDAPVPEGMEFFDVPVMTIAKGWSSCSQEDMEKGLASSSYAKDSFFAKVEKAKGDTFDAIKQAKYDEKCWKLTTKVFPAGYPKNPVPDENGRYIFGTYIACDANQ